MKMLVASDCFRIDAEGNLLSPAGAVIVAAREQSYAFPGAILASTDLLNQVYRMGIIAGTMDQLSQRLIDRARLEQIHNWLQEDLPDGK